MGKNNKISRAHSMIIQLERHLGSLDHLCFAFPQVLLASSQFYQDPSVVITAAIAMAPNPPAGRVKSTVGDKHPDPGQYLQLDGISSVEIVVPSNSAKKLLRRRCLVVEQWDDIFVCRVPNDIRDRLGHQTMDITGIPAVGHDWSLPVVKKLHEVASTISERRETS